MKKRIIFVAILLAFLLSSIIASDSRPVSAYTPQRGDFFRYSETITVNNGGGSYTGYNDQSQITGTEQMNGLNGNIVSASFGYSSQYSNNQGNSTSRSDSGNYTWTTSNFTYVNGSDGQTGYSKPIYVWFVMNPSLSVGSTFYVLNTKFTVLDKNYSFDLPQNGSRYVQTIHAEGTGTYQRNDSYGVFTASYTWDSYFDPSTGYVAGYKYVEQDNGEYQGQAGSFTYTDNLYVTATSYSLAPASPPTNLSTSATTSAGNIASSIFGMDPILIGSAVIVLIIILIAVYAAIRGRGKKSSLPQHPYTPTSPPPTPWQSNVDLGSKPSEQVVIREAAKVNCKYCGTLIPTTADTCPYCGAPRQ